MKEKEQLRRVRKLRRKGGRFVVQDSVVSADSEVRRMMRKLAEWKHEDLRTLYKLTVERRDNCAEFGDLLRTLLVRRVYKDSPRGRTVTPKPSN